jgi:peptide/nickel transport system substrate-binding protein
VLDSLFVRTRTAVGDADRIAAWRDVQRLLADEAPIAWVYHSRGLQGISARLRNVTMDLRGEMATLAQWQIGPAVSPSLARR